MKPIYNFGMSQEDANTEQSILGITEGDRLLCIASGGELPLNLAVVDKQITIDAVDVSPSQIFVCKMKLLAALYVESPDNAGFLGYMPMKPLKRLRIYNYVITQHLSTEERIFWDCHLNFIKKGIINCGKFEMFLKKLRFAGRLAIGRMNLQALMTCTTIAAQEDLFDRHIGRRKILRLVFKFAFRPTKINNCGLDKAALRYAKADAGKALYNRFRLFCTGTPVHENYFLQYFLTGRCINPSSLPAYLQPKNKNILRVNSGRLSFINVPFNFVLKTAPEDTYSKIHMSNISDWQTETDFHETMAVVYLQLAAGGKICSRYLQKDHFTGRNFKGLIINAEEGKKVLMNDRFPFYTIIGITSAKEHISNPGASPSVRSIRFDLLTPN